MLYSEARNQIASGDLIAFARLTFFGRLVRMYTSSSYSHVGVAAWFETPAGERTLWVVESREFKGFTMRELSSCGPFSFVATNGTWTQEADQFMRRHVGRSAYDVLGGIVRRIFMRPPVRDEHYICSEAAGELLQKCGVKIEPEEFGDPESVVLAAKRAGPLVDVYPDPQVALLRDVGVAA